MFCPFFLYPSLVIPLDIRRVRGAGSSRGAMYPNHISTQANPRDSWRIFTAQLQHELDISFMVHLCNPPLPCPPPLSSAFHCNPTAAATTSAGTCTDAQSLQPISPHQAKLLHTQAQRSEVTAAADRNFQVLSDLLSCNFSLVPVVLFFSFFFSSFLATTLIHKTGAKRLRSIFRLCRRLFSPQKTHAVLLWY